MPIKDLPRQKKPVRKTVPTVWKSCPRGAPLRKEDCGQEKKKETCAGLVTICGLEGPKVLLASSYTYREMKWSLLRLSQQGNRGALRSHLGLYEKAESLRPSPRPLKITGSWRPSTPRHSAEETKKGPRSGTYPFWLHCPGKRCRRREVGRAPARERGLVG